MEAQVMQATTAIPNESISSPKPEWMAATGIAFAVLALLVGNGVLLAVMVL